MSLNRRIRIVIADDHPMFREGMVVVLNNEPDMVVVGEHDNGSDAVKSITALTPDVSVLDLQMPGMNGTAAIAAILKEQPERAILILTAYSGRDDIQRAMRAGARGYLLKESSKEEVLHAIREIAQGRFYLSQAVGVSFASAAGTRDLTTREREVLGLMSEGKSNKEIGSALGITEVTVKTHVTAIMQKMKAGSRTEVAFLAAQNGFLRK